MKFKHHFIIGFIISFVLVEFFNFSLISGMVIFFASWLIDADHYFWYGLSRKDWNPFHAIKWYIRARPRWNKLSFNEKEKFKKEICFLHGIEFILIIMILSFFYKVFFWILLGIVVHMIADCVDLKTKEESLWNKLSSFYIIKKNKGKRDFAI